MQISKDDLKHIAGLSKLEIEEENLETFLGEFTSILNYFKELQELPPQPQTALRAKKQPIRDDNTDLPDHFTDQEKLIEAFPQKKDRYVKVPAAIKDHKDQ